MRFIACVCAGVVSGCACVVHECSFLVKGTSKDPKN